MRLTVHALAPWFQRAAAALSVGLLAACAQTPVLQAPAPRVDETLSLRLIAFNDFHGHLEAEGKTLQLADPAHPGQRLRVAVGGADALAGAVAALRAGAPHSLLNESGDLVGAAPLVSTLFRHESTVEVMNQIGVDLGVPGNHEFDAGQLELQRLVGGGCATNLPQAAARSCGRQAYAGVGFALIAANIIGPSGAPLFAPSWVRQVGPVKVGFIGATTRSTPGIVMPSGVAGLRFDDEAEAINRSADLLQAQGVHALVVVVHEGGELGEGADWNDARCPGWHGALAALERRITPAVDLIFSAHTHQGYNCRFGGASGGRLVLQATSYGRGLSVVDLRIDARSGRVDRVASTSRNLPVLNAQTDPAARAALLADTPAPYAAALRAQPDAAVGRIVADYAALAAPRARQTVGHIGGSFERSGRSDSAAGRLIADAQLEATRAPEVGGAQIALMNAGGIRADLRCSGTPPCAVSFGDAFTMQPFGNGLVVMSLSGAQLKALLESQQPEGRGRPNLLIPSRGLSYRWLAHAPQGQRVSELRLDQQPVRDEARYRITVNGFLAEGGDGFGLLKGYGERVAGPQDIDALLAYLKRDPAPEASPRVTWVD